ncbi:S-phase kinase-associated protein 2 [Contarinia nasturtii]|uniref:S-phase kinase-associated protein 2 n=1 Tax=Contarinia nasturtii TaxID=265458 RepID=UPI0012D41CFA|nr:S-phase kinase-associated protein 2 [Contarinia nasturtii]
MDETGSKHKLNTSDTDDENSYISNKRQRNSPTDENLDPSSSVDKSESSHIRFANLRSASKSSPLSSLFAVSDMGFGVLDSDESNQSSLVSSAIASFAPPSSALSMIPPDTSNDSIVDESDLAEPFSETESNLDQNTMSDVHLSSNEANSLPTLNGSESKNECSNFPTEMQANHDFTPATLIPCNRTNFRGILQQQENVGSNGSSSTSGQSTSFAGNQTIAHPPEGRAILGNSMKKIQKENTVCDSPMKHKGRSPLATIGNATPIQSPDLDDIKKAANNGDSFFMYQRRDPRLYTGEDNFTKLSDEVLLLIFKWLPKKTLNRCSLVNHRFCRVVQDESLWARLDLAGKTIQPYALGRILVRGAIILRLAQSKILEPIFDMSRLQKDYSTKVQYLDLSMAVISTDSLVQLFTKCRQLRKLSLEHVPVNDAVCKAIAQNRKLEVLNLSMCTGINPYGVKKILGSLKGLHTLNISWTSLEVHSLREFAHYINDNMTRLNIAGCRKTMTDDILKKIVSRCPQLRELDLSDCTALTSETIGIVANLEHLEYLSLSRCYNLSVSAYLEIYQLKALQFIDVFGVLSDQALSILSEKFPHIGVNKYKHSAVARPTVGSRRTSIWGLRTRD